MIHLPRFFSSYSALPGKSDIRIRRPSAKDGHVPQGFKPLDDALAHACGENAPQDNAEAAVFPSVSKKYETVWESVHEHEEHKQQQE